MREVVLLPLVGLVPFPAAPPYVLTAPTLDAATQTIGLIHSPPGQGLASVGVLATATQLTDNVLSCTPTARFQLERVASGGDGPCPPVGRVKPLDDDAPDAAATAEAAALHEECWLHLQQLATLRADEGGGGLSQLESLRPSAGSPSDFSFGLAAASELQLHEAQTLLEMRCAARRLRFLRERLGEALAFEAVQAALRRLGAG